MIACRAFFSIAPKRGYNWGYDALFGSGRRVEVLQRDGSDDALRDVAAGGRRGFSPAGDVLASASNARSQRRRKFAVTDGS